MHAGDFSEWRMGFSLRLDRGATKAGGCPIVVSALTSDD
jgi:hypothetical protein